MFQRNSPPELPDWVNQLVKWGILAVVFVAPIVKGMIETLKQRRAAAEKARAGGSEPESAAEGRQSWKDLVAGRSTPPPISRVPAPRSIQAPAEMEAAETLVEPPPPPFVELPSRSIPPLPAGVQDEEDLVEEQVAERERAEFQRQEQVVAAEYAAASPYRKSVEPLPASAVEAAPGPAPSAPGPAERWLFPPTRARNRREALVRAMVLRELLGPPVALRRVEEPWSATG